MKPIKNANPDINFSEEYNQDLWTKSYKIYLKFVDISIKITLYRKELKVAHNFMQIIVMHMSSVSSCCLLVQTIGLIKIRRLITISFLVLTIVVSYDSGNRWTSRKIIIQHLNICDSHMKVRYKSLKYKAL